MVNVVIFCCATEVFRKGCLYFEEFIFPYVIYNPKVRETCSSIGRTIQIIILKGAWVKQLP